MGSGGRLGDPPGRRAASAGDDIMTPHYEPQLGGRPRPDTSDAPMISSVETRTIASARGAYVAGNLNGLIDRLNVDQLERFRRAVERQALALVARWLDHPTQGGELAIRVLAADFNATIRHVLPMAPIRMERLIAYFLARSVNHDSSMAA